MQGDDRHSIGAWSLVSQPVIVGTTLKAYKQINANYSVVAEAEAILANAALVSA